jgi:hypothetical protein
MGQPITPPRQPWRANQRVPGLQSLIHSPVEAHAVALFALWIPRPSESRCWVWRLDSCKRSGLEEDDADFGSSSKTTNKLIPHSWAPFSPQRSTVDHGFGCE